MSLIRIALKEARDMKFKFLYTIRRLSLSKTLNATPSAHIKR